MIPTLCYVPPSVELLGPTTPQFSNPDPQSPSFQARLTPLAIAIISRGSEWLYCGTLSVIRVVPNDSQIIIIITILPITGRSPSFTVDMRLATLSLVRPIAAPLFAILPELLDGFFQRTYRTLISCDWVSLSDIKLRTLLVIGYFIRVYSIKRV